MGIDKFLAIHRIFGGKRQKKKSNIVQKRY